MSRAMKDSGIPWIGEIPKDWEVCFIKQIMRNKSIKGYPNEMVLSLYRDYGVVPKDSRSDNHNVTSEDTSSYKFVEVGDFVINKMKAWQGSMAVSEYRGIISPAYYICRFTSTDINKRYIHYLLRNDSYKTEYMRLSSGLRVGQWDLNIDDFLRIMMILPPLAEQQRIAEFLDRKCAEIDEMIALQEQIIEELKAYKQSVITEAATKGLNPDVPMKDSGIEWIGQIPEHWDVKRLKFVAERHNQKVSDEVLPYIGLENVESFSERFIETENEYDITQAQVCAVGDVIFGKLRPYLGKAMVIKTEHCCSSEFLVLSGSGAPSYLRYLLLSDWFVEIVNASTYGTKMPRANADYIMNMQVVCPPIDERKAIADYLDEKCADIDNLIQTKQSKIDSLKEYKKSIIYEYVTGKKEVTE